MKTSEGFLHLPDCSDLCEESHVRLLSLANRISSNRFSEKSGSPGVLWSSQLLEHSERLCPFFFSSHVCMCIYAQNSWVCLFLVFFCLCGVVLDVMREISWLLTQLPAAFYRCLCGYVPVFLMVMSASQPLLFHLKAPSTFLPVLSFISGNFPGSQNFRSQVLLMMRALVFRPLCCAE